MLLNINNLINYHYASKYRAAFQEGEGVVPGGI